MALAVGVLGYHATEDMPWIDSLLNASMLLGAVVLTMGLRLPATWPEWRHMLIFSTLNNALPFALISAAQREPSRRSFLGVPSTTSRGWCFATASPGSISTTW